MANFISDVDLALQDGEFAPVLSADEPADLAGAQWVKIPDDASSVVVRKYIGDPVSEELATPRIDALDPTRTATGCRPSGCADSRRSRRRVRNATS
jgi:hypothetical protein